MKSRDFILFREKEKKRAGKKIKDEIENTTNKKEERIAN